MTDSPFFRSLLALFLTGIAVELTLSPIALYHFHQTGILGAFANIVAIPLTTFVIMPVEALALLLDLVGLGAPAWWITVQDRKSVVEGKSVSVGVDLGGGSILKKKKKKQY